MTHHPQLTIIIVHYNTPKWIETCVASLSQWVAPGTHGIHVVVVDNGSAKDMVEHVRHICARYPWVELLISPTNLGFAGGNNLALQQVKTPYVMLLNSDAEAVAQTNVPVLLTYMDAHPDVAVVTPKVILPSGDLDWACHRGEPTLWAAATYFSGLSTLFSTWSLFTQYHLRTKNLDTIHPVDAVSGAAMVVRTSAMRKVGYLDERFFMYAEDLDWCKRFRDAGFLVVYHPGSVVVHHKYKSGLGNTNRQQAKQTSAHFYRTMIQYFDKHHAAGYPRWVRSVITNIITFKKGVL